MKLTTNKVIEFHNNSISKKGVKTPVYTAKYI